MRHTYPLGLTGLVAALLAGSALAAPIYKWQDAEGRVHYEDTRPPEGEVKIITPPPVYRGDSPPPSTPADGTANDRPASTAGSNGEERARKCAESREALAQGQTASRMYTLDDRGNRTYLSAGEIDAHVAKLKQAVDSWCGAQ